MYLNDLTTKRDTESDFYPMNKGFYLDLSK